MASSLSSLCSAPHSFLPHSLSLHHLPLNVPLRFKFKALKFTPKSSSCRATTQTDADRTIKGNPEVQGKKKLRKPRPSFCDQISQKWSRKPIISTNLPWEKADVVEETIKEVSSGNELNCDVVSSTGDSIEGDGDYGISNTIVVAPWERKPTKTQLDYDRKLDKNEKVVKLDRKLGSGGEVDKNKMNSTLSPVSGSSEKFTGGKMHDFGSDDGKGETSYISMKKVDTSVMSSTLSPFSGSSVKNIGGIKLHVVDGDIAKGETSGEGSCTSRLPWERELGGRLKKGNAELAERTMPEHELKRLRNVALRMLERTKVGEAGITQSLVDEIHEKWKIDEIVKLKFEGSQAVNMQRTHETLEHATVFTPLWLFTMFYLIATEWLVQRNGFGTWGSPLDYRKTGGLVIWRSGSSAVLYRGMNYKFDCVQSYNKQKSNDLQKPDYLEKSAFPDSLKRPSNLSEEELMNVSELQDILDKLGPPFEDWTGIDPKPVDADLLPGVIPGYRPPFRLLPYGMRLAVRNKEMTFFRHQARRMRPHFALGRNRELEGLAAAMVKLWEKSAIAKIAIKRGVFETCNDKMAEDLKKLTGGTLLSRNKEYIVFYRGNDFLPPAVTESLKEREKLTGLHVQEEEAQRDASLLIASNAKTSKRPLVAGTLAETVAATSRWGKQTDSEDLVKMLKDSAIARHASLVKYLENKLNIAKRKLRMAERALAKVQACLRPAELSSDQEMLTDEERFLFRKMGLSMKPFLLLGRRGVFDGSIENMHLHWKFRELVKIIVRGKSFAQVKHIAISLEAESGGVFVSVDKTTKGYAIIIYRGKNYQKPLHYRPRNLLSRREALARSIELQRREALMHHVSDLVEKIELIKSELDDMKNIEEIDDKTLYARLDGGSDDDDDELEEDDSEEAYLEVYDDGDDIDNI